MNDDLQKNMNILMGKGTGKTAIELIASEKKKLDDAYSDLFFGLAGANWARGDKALGAAWYEALQQIDGMMGAKNKNNPAAMYLNQIFAAHRIKWSQRAMTSQLKDKKMEMSDTGKQKWSSECAKQIGAAMAVINVLMLKYDKLMSNPQQVAPTQIAPNTAAIFMSAKQRIMNGR